MQKFILENVDFSWYSLVGLFIFIFLASKFNWLGIISYRRFSPFMFYRLERAASGKGEIAKSANMVIHRNDSLYLYGRILSELDIKNLNGEADKYSIDLLDIKRAGNRIILKDGFLSEAIFTRWDKYSILFIRFLQAVILFVLGVYSVGRMTIAINGSFSELLISVFYVFLIFLPFYYLNSLKSDYYAAQRIMAKVYGFNLYDYLAVVGVFKFFRKYGYRVDLSTERLDRLE